MAICPQCGNPLADGAKFCTKCGTPVIASVEPQPEAPQPNQPNFQQPNQPNQPNFQQPNQPNFQQPNQPNFQQPNQPAYQHSYEQYRQAQQNGPQPNAGQNGGTDFFESLGATDHTDEFDAEDIQKNKTMSLFAYLGLLFLIPLFSCKDSKFARFHINQGLYFGILSLCVSFLRTIILSIFGLFRIRIFVILINILFGLVGLALLVIGVLGIINAVSGKAKKLPLIGKIKVDICR